jgi:DNA-binding MarR family transcriptional regulator
MKSVQEARHPLPHLTHAQARVIQILWQSWRSHGSSLSQTKIAREMSISQARVSQLERRLEIMGWLRARVPVGPPTPPRSHRPKKSSTI